MNSGQNLNVPWKLRKHFIDGWTNRTAALASQVKILVSDGVVV